LFLPALGRGVSEARIATNPAAAVTGEILEVEGDELGAPSERGGDREQQRPCDPEPAERA